MKNQQIKVNAKRTGSQARKSVEVKNKEIVKQFFLKNPGETKAECCRATKLTYPTVIKHVKAILAEQETEEV